MYFLYIPVVNIFFPIHSNVFLKKTAVKFFFIFEEKTGPYIVNTFTYSTILKTLHFPFRREGAVAKKGGEFRSGVGDIMLDDVQCKGTERSIYNCSHRGLRRNNCRHIEDAGVVCKETQTGGAVRGSSQYVLQ